MKRSDQPLSCARLQVLLEAYLDDDLPDARRVRVESHLHRCVDCQTALATARRVQVTLRALPTLQAPAALPERLRAALPSTARGDAQASPSPHWQDRLASAVSRVWDVLSGTGDGAGAWLRPAAAVLVLALVVYLWADRRESSPPDAPVAYTQEELQQAEAQTRWALAYLARVTASAGDTAFIQVGDVMGDVIGNHVLGSVTDAVGRSMQPRSEPTDPGTEQEEVQAP